MSLTPEQVRQIAHLARLELKSEKETVYAKQLTHIFEMVGQLSKAQTEGVAPMAHPLEMTQRLRTDAVTESDRRTEMQAHAPSVEGGLYLVPKVIE